MFSRKKKHSPSNLTPAQSLTSRPQSSQQLQFPTESQLQSHSQSPQEKQQSQNACRWFAYAPPFGQSTSPFLRECHTLSTSATVAGELFLFGGFVPKSKSESPSLSNDLYMISTRDFSTNLLQTSGDAPSPRYGHAAMLTSTTLLIWGGTNNQYAQTPYNDDDSLYLLNLVSREWTRMVLNGPGPGGRFYHTLGLVGSKLFIFGGRTSERRVNDIWALDLNLLKSNPFWEAYDPAPGNKKPLPRSAHISVTTGDRIIIFGGSGGKDRFNDTWSFNFLTRKWTELQCTGSIPSPRAGHAAVLINDIMYVFGGCADDGTYLDGLTALNLSTQRWITFQGIGPSPSGRSDHAMACDETRVFVLGGDLSPGAQADETKPIHVLDTKHLDYPEPNVDGVNPSEKVTHLVGKSPASPPTQGRPHQPLSSSPDAHATRRASPFQKATLEELDQPTSQQIARERNPGLNDLQSRQTGASGRPGRLSEEDDDSEGSTEHHAKLMAPDGKEIARSEDRRLIQLERQLSETLVAKTERDRRIGQLIDELALKNAQAAEEKERAGQELRKLQAKLDESLLSRNHALGQAEENAAEEKRRARLEQRELQAKFDELKLSRDEHVRTLEQTQSALQKATSRATDADERIRPACEHGTELAEVRAELEGKKSELDAIRLRLMDAENRCAMSNAEADKLRAQTTASLSNTDVDRVMHTLMERMRTMEAEKASGGRNEKSIEDMECRNEG